MKRLPLSLLLFIIFSLLGACGPTTKDISDAKEPESALIPLLVGSSDIIFYDCKWINTFSVQTKDPDDLLSKSSDESVYRVLDGVCVKPGTSSFHITIRHELYLYKTSEPYEISSYLVAENPEWRDFNLGFTSNYESVNKCVSYKKVELQDCFLVSRYNRIVSVVVINSKREIADEHLKLIAIDIFHAIEKRISAFAYK